MDAELAAYGEHNPEEYGLPMFPPENDDIYYDDYSDDGEPVDKTTEKVYDAMVRGENMTLDNGKQVSPIILTILMSITCLALGTSITISVLLLMVFTMYYGAHFIYLASLVELRKYFLSYSYSWISTFIICVINVGMLGNILGKQRSKRRNLRLFIIFLLCAGNSASQLLMIFIHSASSSRSVTKTMKANFKIGMMNYFNDTKSNIQVQAVDAIQDYYQCCGYESFTDYRSSPKIGVHSMKGGNFKKELMRKLTPSTVPVSCCTWKKDTTCNYREVQDPKVSNIWDKGCNEKIMKPINVLNGLTYPGYIITAACNVPLLILVFILFTPLRFQSADDAMLQRMGVERAQEAVLSIQTKFQAFMTKQMAANKTSFFRLQSRRK